MSAAALISALAEGGSRGLFSGVGELAKDIRVAITGKDPAKMAEIEARLIELEYGAQSAQVLVNLEEAKSPNLWTSGWRPGVGWTCSAALAFYYVIGPLMTWGARLAGSDISLPEIDINALYPLLLALLGMGGMRSYEKVNGVKKKD